MRHDVDVCIVGAGSAGLSVAAGCAQLGLSTALIEQGAMGGECLNTGCVPSKALLAAAKRAHAATAPAMAGLGGGAPTVDFGAVKDGVRSVIDTIAPHDSAERFEGMGVTVLRGTARFENARALTVGDDRVRARWFVLATGSRPAIPVIPGLDVASILTNETIFGLRDKPDHLLIVGGGPIGVEMAVAHRRLGVPVTLIERGTILPRDEPDLVEDLRQAMRDDGITLLEQASIVSVVHGPGSIAATVQRGRDTMIVTGSHCLVATGRAPAIAPLNLEAPGIASTAGGITVDARLRTNLRHVFALGDVIDGPRFTHVASYQAGIVVRNIAFRLPAKVDYRALAWVTYTDPELAHVGLTEAAARVQHGRNVSVLTVPLARNDRAVAERRPAGSLKVVVGRGSRILGASILAPSAGEIIGLWCLALNRKLTLKAVADLMLPYPTLGETAKAAASDYYKPALFSRPTRRLVSALGWLPR